MGAGRGGPRKMVCMVMESQQASLPLASQVNRQGTYYSVLSFCANLMCKCWQLRALFSSMPEDRVAECKNTLILLLLFLICFCLFVGYM